ncbi:MAG: VWA domain-containing protein, partial [Firmicutes bacterium]|nr:VWA domain-containing protein [Bacillota bacterium]
LEFKSTHTQEISLSLSLTLSLSPSSAHPPLPPAPAVTGTAAMEERYRLTTLQYPIVVHDDDDWAEYIDEYVEDPFTDPPSMLPNAPGIAIIDQTGNFYAIRTGAYYVHECVDWVVKKLNELLGGRRPVDTMLVLDRSGTMGGLPPSGGTDPKLAILKDSVSMFLDVWEANAVTGDRVGVVDFSTDVSHYTQPGTGASMVALATEATAVRSYVNSLSAGGWTCMGGGVATALDLLPLSPRRHIILFSDGMQNYNPVLADVFSDIQILRVDPADVSDYNLVTEIYGDSGVPPKPGTNLQDFETHIHTIGVGLPGVPWTQLMSRLALETDGLHFQTPAPATDLQHFYINDLLESFKGATPQLVQYNQGILARESYSHYTCWINRTACWLTVAVSWQGDIEHNQILCQLEAPDGTLIEIHSRTKSAPRHLTISFPLPTLNYDRIVNHAGRWKLHVMGTARETIPYQVFWIVDDHRVHFDVDWAKKEYQTGDSITLKFNLSLDGDPLPVRHIINTKVRVSSPSVDFNKFLDRYQVDPAKLRRMGKKMRELGIVSEQEQKLYILSSDKEAVAHCTKMQVHTIPVEFHAGWCVSELTFNKPGIHRFDLYVTALENKKLRILRTRTLNIFVKSP